MILNNYWSSKWKWVWGSIYIDLLLVGCCNVNSSECATHWERTVFLVMDRIALFHFTKLVVVKAVMGFLKYSTMPAIVIDISVRRHLTIHCYSIEWPLLCHEDCTEFKCEMHVFFFYKDMHLPSIGNSCTTSKMCICKICKHKR